MNEKPIRMRQSANCLSVAWRGFALLLLLTVMLSSFMEKDGDSVALTADQRRRFDYFFLEAQRLQQQEQYAAAFDLLNHCLDIDSTAAEVYFCQAMYYSLLKQDSAALCRLERAAALRPDNMTYLERVAQYYYNTQNVAKAIEAYERIADRYRDRSDVQNILLHLYQQQKDYDQMLRCIHRIEQIDGNSEEIALSKVMVYELKEDKKSAFKVLKDLSAEHPYDLNYRVMMGNWLMQNDKPKEAYRIYLAASKEDPENTYVQSSLYDYYKAVGNDSVAQQLMERILINPKTEPKGKVTMMRQVIEENERQGGDSLQVLQLFDRIRKANPNDVTMAELKVAYMSMKHMPDSVVDGAMRQVLQIAPDHAAMRMQVLQHLLREQRWEEVAVVSQAGTEYNPEEMAFYYFLGLAHYQTENNDAALDALRRGIGVVNDESEPAIVSDLYSIMGNILNEKGLKQQAYEAFDSCLKWKSDNIECLNNYAYYLSVENKELDKAAQMSYKTIKAEPRNASYLDTYAWILFRQERYAEAKIYIDQALANDTVAHAQPSAVVLEHAGDIYVQNGLTAQAVAYWQQALQAGGGSAQLPKKIQLQKYIADDDKNNP
ncbi:MAG: tetratricopeptide repeat protein [Prevotella sp.]